MDPDVKCIFDELFTDFFTQEGTTNDVIVISDDEDNASLENVDLIFEDELLESETEGIGNFDLKCDLLEDTPPSSQGMFVQCIECLLFLFFYSVTFNNSFL